MSKSNVQSVDVAEMEKQKDVKVIYGAIESTGDIICVSLDKEKVADIIACRSDSHFIKLFECCFLMDSIQTKFEGGPGFCSTSSHASLIRNLLEPVFRGSQKIESLSDVWLE